MEQVIKKEIENSIKLYIEPYIEKIKNLEKQNVYLQNQLDELKNG